MAARKPAKPDFEPVLPDDAEVAMTEFHEGEPKEAVAAEAAETWDEAPEGDGVREMKAYEEAADSDTVHELAVCEEGDEGAAAWELAAYEKSRGRDPTKRLDDYVEPFAGFEAGIQPAEATEEAGSGAQTHQPGGIPAPGPWPAVITVGSVFLLLLAAAFGSAFWYYQARILPRLDRAMAAPAPPILPAPAPAVDLAPLEARIAGASAQLADLQKQLKAERDARLRSDQQIQEMSGRVSDLILKQSSLLGRSGAARDPKPDTSGMPALTPTLTPSISELVLLKERNRLAAYGDEAIATGRRDALQAIVDAMLDPSMKQLYFAAQAEFKRVQSYYTFSVSIDPGYTLPVHELFKGPAIRSEKDLTPAQLTKILLDHQQPWEARLRSAFLLRTSTEADTDRVLLRALKEDPSLDVAKQAQTTFEKLVGRRFRLFDIPAIEAWWQMQGNLLLAPPGDEKSR